MGSAHPRNDGRVRSAWTGEPNEGEEEYKAYLFAEPDKLRVFRCPECEVRIAQEADVCRRPSLNNNDFTATFTRTFNMVRVQDSVCCCRCGVHLFPYDSRDPMFLTLPLYWEGKRVFLKTALRCIVVVTSRTSMYFANLNDDGPPEDLHDGFVNKLLEIERVSVFSGRDVDWTHLISAPVPFLNQEEWERKAGMNKTVEMYRNAGVKKFQFKSSRTAFHESILGLPTHDFAWMIKDQGFDGADWYVWTDYMGYRYEKTILHLWLICGGNVLLADWFVFQVRSQEPLPKQRISFDADIEADKFAQTELECNRQPAFQQLLRNGHYTGYWSVSIKQIPDLVLEKVYKSMDYRHLYPRWLFIHDFPESVFDINREVTLPDTLRKKHLFALSAKNKVIPWFRPRNENQSLGSCLIQ